MSKQWATHPHRETQRDTHTHSSTAMHTDTRCCCCLLLRVVQTIFNTFTIIVNVCKISGIMCVWESKRGREPTQERARVCYICVRVCVCAKWTFDFTGCCFLPVFYNTRPGRARIIERGRGSEKDGATPWSAAVLGILYVWGTVARPASRATVRV